VALQRLPLSRATLQRAAHRRSQADLVPRLLADPATAVLLLDGDRAPVLHGSTRLALVDPVTAVRLPIGAVAGAMDGWPVAAFLGEDGTGRAHVVLARPGAPRRPRPTPDPPGGTGTGGPSRTGGPTGSSGSSGTDGARGVGTQTGTDSDPDTPAPDGARWLDLRAAALLLDDLDAGIMTCAVALANWHGAHSRCARCGAGTEPVQAGWARACPACGAEHYPRTDPAVIMAVVDGDNRILLGRPAHWARSRYSTLAGFVEPGESLEDAVRREVAEETGVVVGAVHYQGSQPWPFPSSLMLGFRAQAVRTEIVVDGVELAQARWWTREELALDLATDELVLPPRTSIARLLIEDWYGSPLSDAGTTWR
jgi:NAD+ diphosphatase